jgi:8-oxo-dGTP diphosphatase
MGRPTTPLLTADIIIEYMGGVVLIERKNEPYGWALPGGFVDPGEPLEEAAIREAREETSLDVTLRDLLYIYGKPSRDPRGHTASVVYIATGAGERQGADDAKAAQVFMSGDFPDDIAFDHKEILADYFMFVKTGRRPVPDPKRPR